jgi:hypothetical protein
MLNLSIWIGRKIFLYSMNRRFGYRINFLFHRIFLMGTDSFNMDENKFSGNSDLLPLTTNRQGGAERGDVVTWQNSANRKHDQRLSILRTVENFSIRSLESKDDVTACMDIVIIVVYIIIARKFVRISFSSYSAFSQHSLVFLGDTHSRLPTQVAGCWVGCPRNKQKIFSVWTEKDRN